MRIGLVVHGQPPELVGGTERLVEMLATSLCERGDQVEVFTGSIEWRDRFEVVREEGGFFPVTRVHRHDLFFERWDKVENPLVEQAYGAWLDGFRPDVVHIHHWVRLTTTLVRVARQRGIPTVLSLHDLFPSCPRYHRVKEDLSFCEDTPGVDVCRHCAPRWSFQGDSEIDASILDFTKDLSEEVMAASARVVPTMGHGRRLQEWLGLEFPVTAIAPPASCGVTSASMPLEDRVASAEDPMRVAFFGHLHPLKGPSVLLQACQLLNDRSLVELHFWGEAPTDAMEEELQKEADGCAVHWHGSYVPEDLSDAPVDVVVLSTLCAESYSLALDEAGCMTVPILASDLGALSDRATDRMALFPRGDAAALAQLLSALASDPGRRRTMRESPVAAQQGNTTHLEELTKLYEQVCGNPPEAVIMEDRLEQRIHAFESREASLREQGPAHESDQPSGGN